MIGNVEIDEKPKTKMNNSVNIINPSHFQKGNMNFSTMFHFTQYI